VLVRTLIGLGVICFPMNLYCIGLAVSFGISVIFIFLLFLNGEIKKDVKKLNQCTPVNIIPTGLPQIDLYANQNTSNTKSDLEQVPQDKKAYIIENSWMGVWSHWCCSNPEYKSDVTFSLFLQDNYNPPTKKQL